MLLGHEVTTREQTRHTCVGVGRAGRQRNQRRSSKSACPLSLVNLCGFRSPRREMPLRGVSCTVRHAATGGTRSLGRSLQRQRDVVSRINYSLDPPVSSYRAKGVRLPREERRKFSNARAIDDVIGAFYSNNRVDQSNAPLHRHRWCDAARSRRSDEMRARRDCTSRVYVVAAARVAKSSICSRSDTRNSRRDEHKQIIARGASPRRFSRNAPLAT